MDIKLLRHLEKQYCDRKFPIANRMLITSNHSPYSSPKKIIRTQFARASGYKEPEIHHQFLKQN